MIIPGLLSDSLLELQNCIDKLLQLKPKPALLHIDIVDSEFTDDLTISADLIRELNRDNTPTEVHLMTVEPIDQIEELKDTPQIVRLIAQIERMSSQVDFIAETKQNGWTAGLALDLYTPLSSIEESALSQIDTLQIMMNKVGEQGQTVHPYALQKIQEAVTLKQSQNYSFTIQVDIGQNPNTIPESKARGAEQCVVGSYIQAAPPEELTERWRKLHE